MPEVGHFNLWLTDALVDVCAGAFVGANAASAVVLTDNLAPFVRGPMRPAAEGYLTPIGLELLSHDTLWGGAIQFVDAESSA